MTKTNVAVIVVTNNAQKYIEKNVLSLLSQTVQSFQVILVDSGSKNTDYLEKYKTIRNFQVIYAETGCGFCKANNIGINYVKPHCEYIFFLNPDAFIAPNFLANAVQFLSLPSNQLVGGVTGITFGYDIENDQPTGTYDTTGIFHSWYGKWYDRGQGKKVDEISFNQTETVPAICGAVYFCRRQAIEEVKIRRFEILDETFYMYKEDVDLSLRLRKKGWKLVFNPALIAYHCRGWSRAKAPRALRLYSAKNEWKLHRKNHFFFGYLYSLLKYWTVKFFDW